MAHILALYSVFEKLRELASGDNYGKMLSPLISSDSPINGISTSIQFRETPDSTKSTTNLNSLSTDSSYRVQKIFEYVTEIDEV